MNETPDIYPHSYSEKSPLKVKHLNLDLIVEFDKKRLLGAASWTIDRSGSDASVVIFDAHGLDIRAVKVFPSGKDADYSLENDHPIFGSALEVPLGPDDSIVYIEYITSPDAAGTQWLEPSQTAGKKLPFLFTQSQAILGRTWIPCQDQPGVRFTYNAHVRVPKGMIALMSASNPQKINESGDYDFVMDQPVPSYLMALAVGELEFRAYNDRCGVYAEPSMIKKSEWEFADTPKMLEVAETMYGPYRWERYDLLVLPPSFPFGGMENPRLTFVTPTVIAGDRSLTSLVAHELAHSWSGNLVTNSTWDDFWLNEGFTVYFERRIIEEVYGKSFAEMQALLGFQDLEKTVAELGASSPATHLKLQLAGKDPDDGMNDIAYEKGYFLLRLIEETIGRENFDNFLKTYFESNAFQTINTTDFLIYLNKELLDKYPGSAEKINVNAWVYAPGIPSNCPKVITERFEKVDAEAVKWTEGIAADKLQVTEWSSNEWLRFIRQLPDSMDVKKMTELDKQFKFTNSGNSEVLAAWFEKTIRSKYAHADAALENFLMNIGRRKFLKPIYKELARTPDGKAKAKMIYEKARVNYHSVSTNTIDEILGLK